MTKLIRTKLIIPQRSAEHVPRARLISNLTAGIDKRLTLISAPAGYGKTTLLTEWVVSLDDTVETCWLSLDENDNDLSQFLIYLVSTLQNVDNRLGKSFLTNIHNGIPVEPQVAMTEIVNDISELAPDRKIILILDDYHFINEPRIHEALNFLLSHVPPTLHLGISTRSDPPLELPRRRARGEMTEIRTADLSFNHAEAVAFFKSRLADDLGDEDVALLNVRTEGWAASMQLAALALQSPAIERHTFIATFAGSDRYVIDYLVSEVIRQQPPDILQFLLDTAILNRLSASLCDAVRQAADSQIMLRSIENGNLFLFPLDNQRIWYRYHHLFADMLRYHLLEHDPERLPILHINASKWYEKQDYIEEAVSHAFAAENDMLVADLIVRHAPMLFNQGKISIVWHWLERLPKQLVLQRSALFLVYGMILWRFGHFEELAVHLQKLPDAVDWSKRESGELLLLKAHLAYFAGDFDRTLILTKKSLELLKEEMLNVRMPAITLQAWCYEAQGKLDAAIDCHLCNAKLALAAGSLTAGVYSMGKLVILYCKRKAWENAVTAYKEAMEIARERNGTQIPLLGPAHIGLGMWHQHQAQEGPAVEAVRQGIALCKQWGGLNVDTLHGFTVLVDILRKRDQEDAVQDAVLEANQFIEQNQVPGWAVAKVKAAFLPGQQLSDPLTPREISILRRLDSDLSTSQIAGELVIGVSTVRTHIKRIYSKLDVHSRHEAVVRAQELDLI